MLLESSTIFLSTFAFLGTKCFKIKSLVCLSLICYFFTIVLWLWLLFCLLMQSFVKLVFPINITQKDNQLLSYFTSVRAILLITSRVSSAFVVRRQIGWIQMLQPVLITCLTFGRNSPKVSKISSISSSIDSNLVQLFFSAGSPRIMTECKSHRWRVLHRKRGAGGGEQERFTGVNMIEIHHIHIGVSNSKTHYCI